MTENWPVPGAGTYHIPPIHPINLPGLSSTSNTSPRTTIVLAPVKHQ